MTVAATFPAFYQQQAQHEHRDIEHLVQGATTGSASDHHGMLTGNGPITPR
jgi:hypothetical protein